MPRVQGLAIRGTDEEGGHLLGEKAKDFRGAKELGSGEWETMQVESMCLEGRNSEYNAEDANVKPGEDHEEGGREVYGLVEIQRRHHKTCFMVCHL